MTARCRQAPPWMNTLIGAFGLVGREQVELLDRLRPVGQALRRAEARAHAVAVEHVALVHLVAVRRIDDLVVGVVELLLVHVEPDQRALARAAVAAAVGSSFVLLFRDELHLLEHGAAGQAVRIGERLEQFEMIVALADDQLDRLARGLDRRGEVARLALELRRLAGADGEDQRRVEPVEMALRATASRSMSSVNFT